LPIGGIAVRIAQGLVALAGAMVLALVAPALAGAATLRQSSTEWPEGRNVKSKLPLGDTFKFTLCRATTVTLTFVEQRLGRLVRRACVAPAAANAGKPRCGD
jgi:hypothetical protein